MVEPAVFFHEVVEDIFAAMAERAVADIVREADGFGEVFVDAESARQRPSDSGHFDGVCQACPVVIGGTVDEHLRFVFEAAETATVQDAVTVALETGPDGMVGFRMTATQAESTVRGVRREVARFKFFPFLSGMCHGGILADCVLLTNSTAYFVLRIGQLPVRNTQYAIVASLPQSAYVLPFTRYERANNQQKNSF
jgi:hypothetical protein